MRNTEAMMVGERSDRDVDRDKFVADCRVRAATDLFAHTWDPVVLVALASGSRRRRELRDAIGGVSDKVLTQALHRLLANGLIDRRAHAEAPPRVEYTLTGLGQSLVDGPMKALGHWANEHGDELLDAQERSARNVIDARVITMAT
ncbi:winged helix-turn-helix transcriptional regulator [Nonomuraea cavernae]|uniref:winged helix-turn-helix transcriptional regulator n=1 Tax=Nonomuraea cavernae TaxID=2045107 RepID=UPI0034006C93